MEKPVLEDMRKSIIHERPHPESSAPTSRTTSATGTLTRPGWDDYFLQIARLVSTRATCLRRQHGAVLVIDKQILATGYNGAPSGMSHCTTCAREVAGCLPGQRYELCRSVHAEMNAITQAAKHGLKVAGATLYVTGPPCKMCARLIVNAGIKNVKFPPSSTYKPEDTGLDILIAGGVFVEEIEKCGS